MNPHRLCVTILFLIISGELFTVFGMLCPIDLLANSCLTGWIWMKLSLRHVYYGSGHDGLNEVVCVVDIVAF